MRIIAIAIVLVGLTACDQARDASNQAAVTGKRVVDDTRNTWRDLFTYRPPLPVQAPQTRYCYQMQSDVVCYDTVQTQQISKLVGYQDGENMSFIQAGGGSLGMSTPASQVASVPVYADGSVAYGDAVTPLPTGGDIQVDNMAAPTPETECVPGASPFACNESAYIKGNN